MTRESHLFFENECFAYHGFWYVCLLTTPFLSSKVAMEFVIAQGKHWWSQHQLRVFHTPPKWPLCKRYEKWLICKLCSQQWIFWDNLRKDRFLARSFHLRPRRLTTRASWEDLAAFWMNSYTFSKEPKEEPDKLIGRRPFAVEELLPRFSPKFNRDWVFLIPSCWPSSTTICVGLLRWQTYRL